MQDPMAGYMASPGIAYTRELSLLQRNAASGDLGPATGAVVRHLPGMAELNEYPAQHPVAGAAAATTAASNPSQDGASVVTNEHHTTRA